MNNEFVRNFSAILSLLTSAAAVITAITGKEEWRAYAGAVILLGLVWPYFWIKARIQRKKELKRIISQRTDKHTHGFIGAFSYTREEALRFYGRHDDIVAICAQIQLDDYRVGVLKGESGVGKTSIIQAGLIPHLEPNHRCVYLSLHQLSPAAMMIAIPLEQFIANQAAKKLSLQGPCDNLQTLSQRSKTEYSRSLIIFLDQFEQIFDRIPEDNRKTFARDLVAVSQKAAGDLKCVISVRKDYFDDVFELFQTLNRSHSYRLEKFNSPQAREIIRKSSGYEANLQKDHAEHPLLAFEDEIISDLQNSDGRIHPFEISLVCWIMIQTKGELTKASYLEGGRKQGWLDRYLNEVLKTAPNENSALQILNSLISGDKSDTLTVEEVATRAGLNCDETRILLDYLEESKIIMKEAGDNVSA